MARIAAASGAIACQTPRPSKMRRLALRRAVVRSSKLGWWRAPRGTLSTSSRRTGLPASAAARLAPTSPPPTMATSTSSGAPADIGLMRCAARSAARHRRLDLLNVLGGAGCEDFRARARHHHVVLDAHTDVAEALRHAARCRRQVDTRLDGERHTGLEHAPFIPYLVVAHVMLLHAEPVTGAVHEEGPVCAAPDERRQPAFQQPERHQPLRDD